MLDVEAGSSAESNSIARKRLVESTKGLRDVLIVQSCIDRGAPLRYKDLCTFVETARLSLLL